MCAEAKWSFRGGFDRVPTVAERMHKIYQELSIEAKTHISDQKDPDVRPILKYVPSLGLWLCADRHGLEVYTYARGLDPWQVYNSWIRQWNHICQAARPNLMLKELDHA